MKTFAAAVGAVALTATAVSAGGVDRSGQSVGIIFEKGNYAELSYGQINPSVNGTDRPLFGGGPTGSVAGNHELPAIALKYDLSDKLSAALIYDNAYGADIEYALSSVAVGGTFAKLDSEGVTALLRYKFNDNFSVHGGVRASKASASVRLQGAAYGGISNYQVDLDENWGTGGVIGVAYEKPEIALRVALTYFSKVNHKFGTSETLGGIPFAAFFPGYDVTEKTSVNTPQAVNLDVQTGIAKDTLLFASARWVDWDEFLLQPQGFMGATGSTQGLIDLEDTITYTLGVGRKFNDSWSGSAFVTYEPSTRHDVSPLSPVDGYRGIGLAAVYTRDNMKVTFGVRYLDLGNSTATPGRVIEAADMTDNSAVAVGVKVGFTF
jgi:long-subunit fatty acid transport protein